MSVGELNKNKNHRVVIKALAKIKDIPINYIICGQGNMSKSLFRLAQKNGLTNRVHLLGFRQDVDELYHCSDIFVFPSFREGLPLSVMEAMAAGLPVICSKIRGNIDLIDSKGGLTFNPKDSLTLSNQIKTLYHDKKLRDQFGDYNVKAINKFSVDSILNEMLSIYKK